MLLTRLSRENVERSEPLRSEIHNTMVHRSEIGDRRIDPVEFAAWCRACGTVAGEMIRQVG